MTKIRKFLGMPGVSPVLRTAVQAGLAVVVAAGVNFVDVSVWKSAALAAGAALFAKLQSISRG